MENIAIQNQKKRTDFKVNTYKNGIAVFIILQLVALFFANLSIPIYDNVFSTPIHDNVFSSYLLIRLFTFFPSFYIASFLIALFFVRGQIKQMWFIMGIDLIYRIILYFVPDYQLEGYSDIVMVASILEIAVLFITILSLKFLIKAQLKKQTIIIWIILGILLLINISQYFGFLRPIVIMN